MLDPKQVLVRLLVSMVLSGLIGLDRESTRKPAGLRTHILVSLGSTLVMLMTLQLNSSLSNGDKPYYSDRLAAQVISGVGFLGAGTILRRDSGVVTGLTTAASLWVVATIGLAVGAGFYIGAILTTILVVITLMVFHKAGKRIKPKGYHIFSLSIVSLDKPGQIGKIGQVLGNYDANILSMEYEQRDNNLIKVDLEIAMKAVHDKYNLLNSITHIENIIEVSHRS